MVRIVTDSTSDLTPQQASQIGVAAVVKLYVRFGSKTYPDGTLASEAFYNLLKTDPHFPSTSQPSVGDFVRVYEQFKGDEIVSIHISRDLSGTLSSAEAARDIVGGQITIIDSRNVNAGLALLVKQATHLAQQGATSERIKAHVESLISCTRLIFALDTLENLRRGGRLGAVQAMLGTMLQFKPIIMVKDGKLEPVERVRTMPKAVARLREIALDDLRGNVSPEIAVMHACAPMEADALMATLRERLKLEQPLIVEAGPAVATHAGPGAVGIAYII